MGKNGKIERRKYKKNIVFYVSKNINWLCDKCEVVIEFTV